MQVVEKFLSAGSQGYEEGGDGRQQAKFSGTNEGMYFQVPCQV